MTWTLCSSGSAIARAGLNANSTITASGSAMIRFSDEAEGYIQSETRTDWVSSYADLDDAIKQVLNTACSSLIAMDIINYDMSGFTSRKEAGTMLDVLDDRVNKSLKTLKDFKNPNLRTP